MVNNIKPQNLQTLESNNNKKFTSAIADSEWYGAVKVIVVKNMKDENVPFKLHPICKEYVNVVP